MKNILFVDDIEMNRKLLLKIFENDFTAFEAENGNDALAIMRANRVDLVITEIFMDGMDGYELIRTMRASEQLKYIPIIAVTESDEASQVRAIEAGANAFIEKPAASDKLRKKVYQLIGRDFGRKDLVHTEFLLDSIPGAVIVYKIHPDNIEILTCSRGLNIITGWEPEELCQKITNKKCSIIHEDDDQEFGRTIEHIVNTKSRAELVYRGIKKDGTYVWLWFQGQYAGMEDGCPIVEGMILDVSSSSNMYQTILDETSALVTIVDERNFEVLYVNRAARELVGENRTGNYVGSVCHKHVFGLDKPCDFCMVNHTKDGAYVNPEINLNGLYYRQVFKKIKWHERPAIMEFTTDITEQRENTILIEKQRNIKDIILDTIPAGIMVFKFVPGGIQIVSVNKSICEMMGMDKEKTLGNAVDNITALTHPDDIAIVLDAAKRLNVDGARVEYEYRHYFKSRNAYIWVLGQGHSVLNEDGFVYAYVSYTDITDRKEVEVLQDKLKTAEISASTKAEFYSQMSHDMRTPMNGILGLAELALQDDNLESVRQDLMKISHSGKYMLSLINDTLDLQRLESNKITLEPEIIRSSELLEKILSIVRPSMEQKIIRFLFHVNESPDEIHNMDWNIRIDTLKFTQIITNILSNAIKFTPTGGTVSMCLEEIGRDGNIVHNKVSISDTGIGMSQEFIEKSLFKPFSQEHSSVTDAYGGSGLGLSIVKKLVDLMGGRIEVSSELGKGTTFTIYIDVEQVSEVVAEETQQNSDTTIEMNQKVVEGKHILLCEDHPLNAEIARRLLKKDGCIVEWAENGEIGVNIFKKSDSGHFAAVLMDIRMPVMDGLEATRAIRASRHPDAKNIPIIAMSANAYQEDVQKSLDAGMNAHIAKPIEPTVFYEVLAKYLR